MDVTVSVETEAIMTELLEQGGLTADMIVEFLTDDPFWAKDQLSKKSMIKLCELIESIKSNE